MDFFKKPQKLTKNEILQIILDSVLILSSHFVVRYVSATLPHTFDLLVIEILLEMLSFALIFRYMDYLYKKLQSHFWSLASLFWHWCCFRECRGWLLGGFNGCRKENLLLCFIIDKTARRWFGERFRLCNQLRLTPTRRPQIFSPSYVDEDSKNKGVRAAAVPSDSVAPESKYKF